MPMKLTRLNMTKKRNYLQLKTTFNLTTEHMVILKTSY